MTPNCRKQISRVAGRNLGDAEAREIDRQVGRSMRALAVSNPDWKGRSKADKLQMAANHAAERQHAYADDLNAFIESNPETLNQPTLELGSDQRVYAPGSPDDTGFITSAERALAAPPARFRDAKALTADQWRKYFREAGVGGDGFDFLIEPALDKLKRGEYDDISKVDLAEELSSSKPKVNVDKGKTGSDQYRSILKPVAKTFLPIAYGLQGATGYVPGLRGLTYKLRVRLEDYVLNHKPKLGAEKNYSEYVSSGPYKKYEQSLIVLPDAAADYKSHNWETKGTVGHIRTTSRKTNAGERVRFVDELQSDLHQEGASRGYRSEPLGRAAVSKAIQAYEEKRIALIDLRNAPDSKTKASEVAELERELKVAQDYAVNLTGDARTKSQQPPKAPGQNWEKPFIRKTLIDATKDKQNLVAFSSHATLHPALQNDGTEKFYDERMPVHIKKVAKEIGASVERVQVEGQSTPVLAIRLNEEAKAKLAEGNVLFQPADGGARAQVNIPGGFGVGAILNDSETLVRLTKAADATSFLHESAHIFLEVYQALEGESAKVDEQLASIRDWLGIEPGAPITRDQHEYFADSFELYLMEGKAPSAELRSVFARFRQWFVNVYRSMRPRLTKLDPEAVEIFDRMLATDEEIGLAREDYQRTLSGHMQGIMSPEQLEKYEDAGQKAQQVAFDKLFRKHMKQVQRRNKAEYRAAKKDAEAVARIQFEAEPVYKARKRLEADKMDLTELREYRKEGFEADAVETGGIHPEIIAADAGFSSADKMLDELASAPDIEQAISAQVEREMTEVYGDLLTDGSAEQEAVEAVFNEPSIRMLEAERDAIAAKAAKDAIPLAAIRAEADRRINELPIKDVIKPGRYAIEARNMHKRAVRAAAKGKWDDALRITHNAMLKHEMARRAYKARDEISRGDRHLGRYAPHKFTAKKVKDKIDPAYVDAIRTLIALPGVDDQAEAIAKLNAFAVAQEAEANVVILPTAVVLGGPLKDKRDMSMDEYRDFKASIQSLNKVGRSLSEEARAERKAEAESIAGVIRDAWKGRPAKSKGRDKTRLERLGKVMREGDALALRFPFLIEMLQGGVTGPLVEKLETKLRQKLTDRNDRRVELGRQLVEIFNKHEITQKELRRMVSAQEIEAGPVAFERIIAVALNMGTQSNRDRLGSDPDIQGDLDALDAMLADRLEKRHWDAVQDIWDLLETLWPETVALEKRVSGIAPQKIPSRRVETPYGSYRGGYFPISYRKDVAANSDIAAKESEDQWKAMTSGVSARASTPQGRVKERQQNVSRPLELSMEAVLRHIDDATTDIYLREEATRLDRLLRSGPVQAAIEETHGIEYTKSLETILKRTVAGTEKARNRLEAFFRGWRVQASVAILGANITTAALAPVSYLQTVLPRYGAKVVLTGATEFYGSFGKASKMMLEKSAFMRERQDTYSREAHELVRNTPFQGKWARFQGAGYWLMSYLEKWTVSGPLWIGIYRQALMDGKSEADAVTAADRAIATTQGSGLEIDQSVLQGGNEFERTITFMWGYLSGYYGIVRNDVASKDGLAKTWPVMKHLILLNLAASTLEALVRGEAWDDDDDPFAVEVANRFGRNVTGIVPGVGSFFSRFDTGAPAIQSGKEIVDAGRIYTKAGEELFERGYVDGETLAKAVRQTVQAVGFTFGVPGTVQADKALKTYFEDDDPTLKEYLITGPDSDN